MGLIITVGITTKGGVGKSTILTNTAVDLARANKDLNIKVFDTDVENSASFDFFALRRKDPVVLCEIIDSTDGIKRAIDFSNRSDKHIAFIDVAGLDSNVTASAVAVSDLLYIPFRMSGKDLKALGTFIEHIGKAKSNGASMECYLVPNYLYANSSAHKVKENLAPLVEDGFKYATALKNRNSYIDSADYGMSVTEYNDFKAGAEIRPLVEIILEKVGNE